MNKILKVILLIALTLDLSACSSAPTPEPTEYVSYSIVEVVDSRYDPPNTYELCYRTTFSNGLTIDCWKMVSREEYEKEVGE